MLSKFSGEGDAYLFLSEFVEMCSMMQFPNVSQDVRLRFIPFLLKDSAKKWMYNLPVNSFSPCGGFVRVFLRKYFPNGKTVKAGNEINHFVQLEKESFWKCFERFKLLLTQCPHHNLERWRLCQIIYEGLDQSTRTMVESMCQGGFLNKSETDASEFL